MKETLLEFITRAYYIEVIKNNLKKFKIIFFCVTISEINISSKILSKKISPLYSEFIFSLVLLHLIGMEKTKRYFLVQNNESKGSTVTEK